MFSYGLFPYIPLSPRVERGKQINTKTYISWNETRFLDKNKTTSLYMAFLWSRNRIKAVTSGYNLQKGTEQIFQSFFQLYLLLLYNADWSFLYEVKVLFRSKVIYFFILLKILIFWLYDDNTKCKNRELWKISGKCLFWEKFLSLVSIFTAGDQYYFKNWCCNFIFSLYDVIIWNW